MGCSGAHGGASLGGLTAGYSPNLPDAHWPSDEAEEREHIRAMASLTRSIGARLLGW